MQISAHNSNKRAGHVLAGLALSLILLMLLASCESSGGAGDKVKLVITPVATPTPTPLTPPTIAPTTYAVRSGDTLSGIATLFGVSVDDIVRTNNIADPNALAEGQVLTIPGRSAVTSTEAPAGTPATPGPSMGATPVPASPTLPPPDVTPPQGPTTSAPTAVP